MRLAGACSRQEAPRRIAGHLEQELAGHPRSGALNSHASPKPDWYSVTQVSKNFFSFPNRSVRVMVAPDVRVG